MTLEELRKAHKAQDRIAIIASVYIFIMLSGMVYLTLKHI